MKLDEELDMYIIDINDVINNTVYSEDDLGSVFGDNKINQSLKVCSKAVYRLIHNHYKGIYIRDHITFMNRKIERNLMDEQRNLKFAIIEFVIGAIQSGMDLNIYLDDPKSEYPKSVYDYLNMSRLLDKSRKLL